MKLLIYLLVLDEKHKMSFEFAQNEDFPVDLYYLIDISNTSKDYMEKLSHLGDLLTGTLKNITSNFRFGFGTFVDESSRPNESVDPQK